MHHLTDDLLNPNPSPHLSTPTPAPLPQAASEFNLFPLLPTELRLKIWFSALPPPRIMPIQFSMTHQTYVPTIAPPLTLSINHESRSLTQNYYIYLRLCATGSAFKDKVVSRREGAPIPFFPNGDTLYITNLAPILTTHLPDLLYNLSTSHHRHTIQSLAIDLRVWNACRDAGLLGVLARMKCLRQVAIVVEFGRGFRGRTAFLETPAWRGDLDWVAKRAGEDLEAERGQVGGLRNDGEEKERVPVEVRCVLLTRGGEQA